MRHEMRRGSGIFCNQRSNPAIGNSDINTPEVKQTVMTNQKWRTALVPNKRIPIPLQSLRAPRETSIDEVRTSP
jgi:hypothetical protein